MMRPRVREFVHTAIAFLIAPLVATLTLVVFRSSRTGEINTNIASVWRLTADLYFFAAAATFVLGLPTFLALRRFGLIRWWSTALVGFFVGILAFVIFGVQGSSTLASHSTEILVWGCIGAFSALVFWSIWRWGRRLPPPAS
jgi:hypothetical protein